MKVLKGTILTVFALVLLWGILYLCIGPIQNLTDKYVFGITDEVVEETEKLPTEDETVETENETLNVTYKAHSNTFIFGV